MTERSAPVRMTLVVLAVLAFGCAPQDAGAGDLAEDVELVHDRNTRTYHLYAPTEPQGDRPLVVLLHGGGGVIDGVLGVGLWRSPYQVWIDVADEHGLYLAAPQGIASHWNDCRANCVRCGEHDDVGFLLALIDELAAGHPIDPSQVYVVGESNGGFMAQRLAQEAPERVAGIGVTISLEPSDSECTRRDVAIPIMYQVGTTDAAIAYDGGGSDPEIGNLSAAETVAYWAGVNGCTGEPTVTAYPDLDPDDQSTARREDWSCSEAPLSMITFEGAGHVTSSIEVEVSGFWEGIAGIQNHDLESARVFWAFFDEAAK